MRGNDLMWRLNEKDATLKLHHGKLNPKLMVRLSLGEFERKNPSLPYWLRRFFIVTFPLDSFRNLTGFRRRNVVNIDHFPPESR
jgi:hypothetical protein